MDKLSQSFLDKQVGYLWFYQKICCRTIVNIYEADVKLCFLRISGPSQCHCHQGSRELFKKEIQGCICISLQGNILQQVLFKSSRPGFPWEPCKYVLAQFCKSENQKKPQKHGCLVFQIGLSFSIIPLLSMCTLCELYINYFHTENLNFMDVVYVCLTMAVNTLRFCLLKT